MNDFEENIRIWERGFEIEHKRRPTEEDVRSRPSICCEEKFLKKD